MPGFVSLRALVEAIAGSVSEAQAHVSRGQIESLASFLDRVGRPHTLDIRIPSLRPDAQAGEEDVYAAPLIALAPHAAMRIRQVEVKFAVELGDLAADEAAPRTEVSAAAGTRRTVTVNPTAGPDTERRGTRADVTLLVECVDPPEGLARLLGEVVKTQGYRLGPHSPSPPPPPPKGPPAAPPAATEPRATPDPRRGRTGNM